MVVQNNLIASNYPMQALYGFLKQALVALAFAATTAHCEPIADPSPASDPPAAAQHASAASTPMGRMHVVDPAPGLFAGADTTVFTLGEVTAPAGTLAELSGAREGAYPVRAPGRTAKAREDEVSPSLPAPESWAVVLCGLVVVAFMARRKIMLLAV